MPPPRDIASQQISFSVELAPGGRFVCTAAYSFAAGAVLETRVLISNAALAKTVRGDERWTYL